MNAKDTMRKGMHDAGERLDELKAEAEEALKKGKSKVEATTHEATERVKTAFSSRRDSSKKPGA